MQAQAATDPGASDAAIDGSNDDTSTAWLYHRCYLACTKMETPLSALDLEVGASLNSIAKSIIMQPKNIAEGSHLNGCQMEGVMWLVNSYENGIGGILADEVGLE